MPRHHTLRALALVVVLLPNAAAGADTRPLSTDRPDRTESAFTVPKGWLQVESDLASYGVIEGEGERVTGTTALSLNLKLGIANRADLQFLFTPWTDVRTEVTGQPATSDEGTGQAGLRAKFNLWGNDGGRTALALLPFALVPTRGEAVVDFTTWGMVAPLAVDLGGDRALCLMAGYTRVDNEESWLSASASLGTPLAGNFAGFVEIYAAWTTFESEAIDDVTLDAGVTFSPDPDWQLDAGFYRGLTTDTEDWRVFLGASARFQL